MHKELLLKAFEKVRMELIQEGIISPSDTRCAQELSAIISKTFSYGERRLRDFYNEARNKAEGDINISQPQVISALAQYLGYEDYRDFLIKRNINEVKIDQEGKRVLNIKNKLTLIVILLFLVGVISFFGYNYFIKQRWMEWQGTHYVEASFDAEKLKTGALKAYKSERLESFEQLDPSCETQFFNDDGSAKVWYVKNKNGTLEFFSSYGLHPKNGKALKPITKYMIEKYICN